MTEEKLLSVAALEQYMEWVTMRAHLDTALRDKHVKDLEKQWRQNCKDKSNARADLLHADPIGRISCQKVKGTKEVACIKGWSARQCCRSEAHEHTANV